MDGQSYYDVLNVGERATTEEIAAAFDQRLAERRARRTRTGDLYAAVEVLTTPALRRAYDLTRKGAAAGERLSEARDAVIEAIPDVDWTEVRQNAAQATLQATVLVAGLTARVSDAVGSASRRVQVAAARRLRSE
jgi:DnaJ-class molecular chaperone